MSDVTNQYLVWARLKTEDQYSSLFIHTSVNEQLRKNLKFFQVPEARIESIYSMLTMRVFDVYANILKCMYSTLFNGGLASSGSSSETQSTSNAVPPRIHTLDTSRPDKYRKRKKNSKEARDK